MSIETDEMFAEEQAQAREEETIARKKAIKTTLEKTKVFKDFVMGREKEWADVKDKVALHMYQLPMAGNDVITKDFLAGCRFFAELVDGFALQFDKAFDELGKE